MCTYILELVFELPCLLSCKLQQGDFWPLNVDPSDFGLVWGRDDILFGLEEVEAPTLLVHGELLGQLLDDFIFAFNLLISLV